MTQPVLESIVINPERTARATVIWLHGLGASGDDFVHAIPDLKLPHQAPVRFVFPHAPARPVTINAGFRMPAWFDIYGLTDDDPVDHEGLKEAFQFLDQLIQYEIEQGMPTESIVLGGFSQGGALALYGGLRYPKRLAGIFALSSYLPCAEQLAEEASQANQGLPIFMAHGDFDGLVAIEYGEKSFSHLQELGYMAVWQDFPMEHEVCPQELKALGKWLCQILDLK